MRSAFFINAARNNNKLTQPLLKKISTNRFFASTKEQIQKMMLNRLTAVHKSMSHPNYWVGGFDLGKGTTLYHVNLLKYFNKIMNHSNPLSAYQAYEKLTIDKGYPFSSIRVATHMNSILSTKDPFKIVLDFIKVSDKHYGESFDKIISGRLISEEIEIQNLQHSMPDQEIQKLIQQLEKMDTWIIGCPFDSGDDIRTFRI